MGVRFEFQNPPLRLDGNHLVWMVTNSGDEASVPGGEIDTLQIARRNVPGPDWAQPTNVDTTPWQYEVPVDAVVEPGTAHTASYLLDWPGMEDGSYTATVWLQQNAHETYAEMYFKVEHGHLSHDHG